MNHLTKSGKLLTDTDIEALADEAEAGYTEVDGVMVPVLPARLDPPMIERPTVTEIIEAVSLLHAAKMGDEPATRMDAHSNRVFLCAECDVEYPCDTMVLLNGKRKA